MIKCYVIIYLAKKNWYFYCGNFSADDLFNSLKNLFSKIQITD